MRKIRSYGGTEKKSARNQHQTEKKSGAPRWHENAEAQEERWRNHDSGADLAYPVSNGSGNSLNINHSQFTAMHDDVA